MDQEIISKIKAGNEDGLRLLYQNYSATLYGIAIRHLNHQMYAEEVLQNTFLKVWNKIDMFDPEKASLYTWMVNILKNSAIDIQRTQKFQKEQKTISFDTDVHSVKQEHILSMGLEAKQLLKDLDEKYVQVLDYLYLRGYSQSEMSEELDIPIGTIKTRVKKALDILRSRLDKETALILGIGILALIWWLYSKDTDLTTMLSSIHFPMSIFQNTGI